MGMVDMVMDRDMKTLGKEVQTQISDLRDLMNRVIWSFLRDQRGSVIVDRVMEAALTTGK